MHHRFLARLAAALAVVAAPSVVAARVIHVAPGVGTLQAAIDAASAGDTLRLERSSYFDTSTYYVGPVSLNKKLKVRGQLGTRIDAGCAAAVAVEISADGAQLIDAAISGGNTHGLRVVGRTGVKLKNMGVFDQCGATGAGIELGAVDKLLLHNVRADDFPIATEIADLAAEARVKMAWCGGGGSGLLSGSTATGLLVRNVPAGTLQLTKCQLVYASDAGIRLQNADGVRIRRSVILGRGTGSTSRGIVVEVGSDDNLLLHNTLRSNQTDVVDDGASNCWRGNSNPLGLPLTGNPSTAGCP